MTSHSTDTPLDQRVAQCAVRTAQRQRNNQIEENPMDRRTLLRLGAFSALGTLATDLIGPASAQSKLVLKATDVHPLGYPTVEAVVALGQKPAAATRGPVRIQMDP